MLLGTLLLTAAATESLRACEANRSPRFEDFTATTEVINDRKLDLSSHPIGRRVRTVLRRAVRDDPPNLAGHFLVVGWGCGTSCSQFAIVNLRSGTIWHDPQLILTRGLTSAVTSRLVVLNPGTGSPAEIAPTSYHLWHDDELEGLCQLQPSRAASNILGGSSNPSLQRTLPGRSPGQRR